MQFYSHIRCARKSLSERYSVTFEVLCNNLLRTPLNSIEDIFPNTKNVLLLGYPHPNVASDLTILNPFISWKIVGRPIAPLPIINPAAPVASIQAAADLASITSPLAITGISTASTISDLRPIRFSGISLAKGSTMYANSLDSFCLYSLANFQSCIRAASCS